MTGQFTREPAPHPGVFRVRPLALETCASWLNRLAATYTLTLPKLLAGLRIPTTGSRPNPATCEIHLTAPAWQRLAHFARIPPAHLDKALPSPISLAPPPAARAAGTWQWLDTSALPAAACDLCTLAHTRGATRQAWIWAHPHRLLCARHRRWSSPTRAQTLLNVTSLPELAASQRSHQRLLHRPNARHAWQWAHAITTRWYDHQHTCWPRFARRLNHLKAINTAAGTTSSLTLTAQAAVIYPETVALARLIATHHHPARDTTRFLTEAAHRLRLSRLAPAPDDLMTTWLTHQPHTPPEA